MCEAPVLEHSLTGEFTPRTGNHHPWYAPCGEFVTKDGNAVIAVTKEEEWEQLCETLGLSALAKDSRFSNNELRVKNREALIAELEKVTSTMGRYEIEKELCEVGVPASAVQTLAEFAANPQTKELNVITEINQPGVGDYTVVSTPIRFSKTPVNPNGVAASFPGANSKDILSELGYSQEKIDELIESGAIYQSV